MGPLKGLKVVEMAGLGPAPFCAMMLADMGADIIRIDRPAGGGLGIDLDPEKDFLNRGRPSVVLDLKKAEAIETVLTLCEGADILLEGFRPGVMEKLGLGPDICFGRNPKLVYGRMTGWGQNGPLAQAVGHDINYIALSGALSMIGRAGEKPVVPLNLVGDFGGGAMFLAFGVMAALWESQRSGKGQVVDAAMVDGAGLLTTMMHSMATQGIWRQERGSNLLDGGAHFYDVYETADGQYVSIGAIEPPFYAELLKRAEITDPAFNDQMNRAEWPNLKAKIAAIFKTKSRAAWCDLMEGTNVCFAPVLSLQEAPGHPHHVARGTFYRDGNGEMQPAAAPRFSRTAAEPASPPRKPGADTRQALSRWGISDDRIETLLQLGAAR